MFAIAGGGGSGLLLRASKLAAPPLASAKAAGVLPHLPLTTRRRAGYDEPPAASAAPAAVSHGPHGFFSKERIAAPSTFQRWWLVPPAVATHICLGSVYAWSLLNKSLVRELGFVGSSSGDWALSDVVPVFATVCAVHGLSAAVLGKWQERVGPRKSSLYGALAFGGGIALGGLGVLVHNLPLLYLGYGVVAGTGIGLSYVPAVATLIRWFPDRRGMATGMTIMGFGGGALVTSPYMLWLLDTFRKAPTRIGDVDSVNLITENGKRFVEVGGELKEAVVATATDLANVNFPGLQEGVYLVGTGSTGAGMTLVTLGLTYFATMMLSALAYRLPPANHAEVIMSKLQKPAAEESKQKPVKDNPMITKNHVHVDNVMKTPQFWLVWLSLASVGATGMGVLSVANNMMADIFSRFMPELVTGVFAASYVMALSAANLGGRLVWASASDYVGRKPMFSLYLAGSIPLYLALPYFAHDVAVNHSMTSLAGFYGATLVLLSFFGGTYSTTPAYEADLFGTKFVGAVHGRMLTASAAGAMVGPTVLTMLRDRAERNAILDLATQVDPTKFQDVFKAPVSQINELIAAKSVSLTSLFEICPPGTIDPIPHLYDHAMYASAALLSVAAVGNFLIRPVNPKLHMPPDAPTVTAAAGTPAAVEQKK